MDVLRVYVRWDRLYTKRWELVVPPSPKKSLRVFNPHPIASFCEGWWWCSCTVCALMYNWQRRGRRKKENSARKYIAVARGRKNEYWEMLRLVVGDGKRDGRLIAKPEIVPWCNVIILCYVYIHSSTRKRRKKSFSSCLAFYEIIKLLKAYSAFENTNVIRHISSPSHTNATQIHRRLWMCRCQGDGNRLIFPSLMSCDFLRKTKYKSQFRIYVDSWHTKNCIISTLVASCAEGGWRRYEAAAELSIASLRTWS